MQVLIFTLLFWCCCAVLGRPSDPVIREFGTQPNNPNVKVFSTYPTLKPPVIKDNPNDLEKGPDQEKYEKDEREVSETKGEEITKAQSNLTDTEVLDETENVTEENILEVNSSAAEPVNNDSRDVLTISENENIEDMSEDGQSPNETIYNSSDDTLPKTKNSDVEIGSDHNSDVGVVPVMEGAVAPISEYDLLSPLVIETPATVIPAIAEDLGEIPEEEVLFAIPEMGLNDDEIYEFQEENPLLTTGVILPELVPMESVPDVGNKEEIIPLKVESTTLSPLIAEESENNFDASEPKQPVAELTGDNFEPMASLTDDRTMLDATVEQEEPFEPLGNLQGESVVEEEDNTLINTSMGEGDLGVSVSMINEVPPIVEVEPESPVEVTEQKVSSGVQTKEDSERINNDNSTAEVLPEEPKDQSIQMAGFMADTSKALPNPEQTTEGVLPSATDLSLILNINDTEDGQSSTLSNDTQISTQVEPMDQMDVIEAQQPTSDVDLKSSPTTEEAVPTLDPMELTADEEANEDPTLNEAI